MLREDMQKAMKAKESVRLSTIRLVLAACTNEVTKTGKKPNEKPEDKVVLSVIRKLVNQRKEAATYLRSAGQEERASLEDKERQILESYLPPEMSEKEVRDVVKKTQQRLGLSEKKDIGTVIKTVMREVEGKASGTLVASIVNEELQ